MACIDSLWESSQDGASGVQTVHDDLRRATGGCPQCSISRRQRIVGATALAGGPKLIIADEPTTNLDVTIQLQYLNLLKELQQQTGVALIFVTHDLGIVAKMCDKVVVMYAWKIVEEARV